MQTEPTGPPQAPPRRRGPASVRSMVWSLGLVGLVVLVLVVVTLRPRPDPVHVVDWSPVVAQVAPVAGFPVLVPTKAEGWRCTSARWATTPRSGGVHAWYSGWVGPDDTFAAVVQARTTSAAFVDEQTLGGRPDGTAEAAGSTWQRRVAGDQRSLVRVESGVTTIVTGTAGWDALAAFTEALTAPKGAIAVVPGG